MSAFSINTNINGLVAASALNRTLLAQQPVFRSLSTGFQINSGTDGPAALISSQNLIASLRVLEAQSSALARAKSVVSVADAALGEVSNLLIDAETIAVFAANTGAITDAEREALQIELDSIVQSVDRIVSTTTFAGAPVFDGALEVSLGGGDRLVVPEIVASQLGATLLDGETRTLGDIQTGRAIDLLSGDAIATAIVIGAARTEIGLLRGELGAADRFTIQPRLQGLAIAIENTSAANSLIVDTDFARATAELSRLSVLAQTGLSLTSFTNSSPQNVLGLLTSATLLFGGNG